MIRQPAGSSVELVSYDSSRAGEGSDPVVITESAVPEKVTVPHRWRDQFAFRLGGDLLIEPDLLTARAGVSYESSGITPAYAQLDFWPTERFGLHGGLTLELGEFDVSLSYAHYFNETVTAEPAEADLPQLIAVGRDPVRVNGGVYASNINVLALGLIWRP